MKNRIMIIVAFIMVMSTTVIAQNSTVNKDDFNKILQQIGDSLPDGWTAKPSALLYQTDLAGSNEIIIQSAIIDLNPDMTSNDPLNLKGLCEIYFMVLPRILPDSINIIRKRNKELQNNLPPQVSKDSLQKWYNQNEKTLKILDAEPTNYNNTYSYRIKCRRLPKNEIDIKKYNEIRQYINRHFKTY